MIALLHLLLLTALTIQTPTLVLRDGARLDVDNGIRVEQGKVIFRSAGSLYSIPEGDVDLAATRAAAAAPVVKADKTMRLKVSEEERDRLLRELEKNHSGTPGTATLPPLPAAQPEPAPQASSDEWRWRRDAQMYEETIRRAREDLDLLKTKAEQLRSHIAGCCRSATSRISSRTTRRSCSTRSSRSRARSSKWRAPSGRTRSSKRTRACWISRRDG